MYTGHPVAGRPHEEDAPREEAFKKHLAAISKAMIEASALVEQAAKVRKA